MKPSAEHAEIQRRYFVEADAERFRWTTDAPGFAETEDELLASILPDLRPPCLELGCGEGNNLVRLVRHVRCVGIDLFPNKLKFAARELPKVPFAVADAGALPFGDGAFGSVFIRDLLHHVPEPERVLGEAVRVLRPEGRLHVLEPNGRNPIVNLQTRLVPAEAEARHSGTARIETLLRAQPLDGVRAWTTQPLPFRRLVLHYRFGMPAVGRIAPARRALALTERVLGGLLPRSRWAYVAAVGTRRR